MKILSGLIFLFLYLLLSGSLNAQDGYVGDPILPIQQRQSPLFGKDIIIKDSSVLNQRQIAVCAAFNGWLYAGYQFFSSYWGCPAFEVFKSEDNGITWTKLIFALGLPNLINIRSFDMVAIGDSLSNLKLFICWINSMNNVFSGQGLVDRFDGVTGNWEAVLTDINSCYSIALSTDFRYPPNNSTHHSLGVLYSAHSYIVPSKDTIVFCSSSNGGISLDGRQIVAVTDSSFHKVSLAYGRSPSWNGGRYYAAWEQKATRNSNVGNIFTAHTEPNFNSPFTTPLELDNLDPPAFNKAKNPVIACQFNNADNDSANLTAIVLFDKYISSTNRYDIEGYYNLQSTNHTHFEKLNISNSGDYICQPSMAFNPFDSTFMVTYYDSTTQKLPFITNDFNLGTPDNWQVISSGYNDDDNLAQPYPKVAIDMGQKKGVNVWTREGTGGNGVALFDSPESNWTGFPGSKLIHNGLYFHVYPNPCNSMLNISFDLIQKEPIKIILYNQLGENIGVVSEKTYSAGRSYVHYSIKDISPGGYYLSFLSNDTIQTIKLIIIR